MKRWTKSRALPLLLAALLALAGCQGPGAAPSTQLSSIPMTPDAKEEAGVGENPAPEEPFNQPESASQPQPPEPEYSDWVLGEWTTEPQEENDLCRLADTKTQETQTWGPWSEWSVEPVEGSNSREVETKVEEGPIIESYIEIPVNDKYGYQTEERVLTPVYKKDVYGYWVMEETTHYRHRNLTTPTTTTLYQYETRQVTNQAELDSWQEQFGGE